MADFNQLKADVANQIKTNGVEAITGAVMQDVLLTIINSIADGYMFGGVAQHSGDVGNPDYNVFYLGGSGSYTGYGESPLNVPDGCYCVMMYNGTWHQYVVDLGVHLTGEVAEGETQGVTGDKINTALNTLFTTITNILDSLEFVYNTPAAQQGTKAMLDATVTLNGVPRVLATLVLGAATAEAAGLLSAEDKAKLDAILTNLRSLEIEDTTAYADLGDKIVESIKATIGGTEETISTFQILAATAEKAGLLSAADKAKLDALWSSGYQFAGIATPSTTPISTTSKIFYIATEAGTYFNTVTVTQGINIIYKSGDTWSVEQVVGIDNEPTAGSDRLVKSGGVFGELALGAVYDVSAKNPTAGPNSDGKWESLSALLSDANLNTLIPTSVRKGGMSIKYVQSSDNKYVQYRLMSDSWSTNTDDWTIADEGVYVENPEFVYVKTDAENKILWAIKTDGSIYYGAGVPQQVVDYINKKIAELSLDEYEDIVAFLNGLEEGDKTLQTLLNEKVDKEEGKSLIDAEYASTKSTVDNPEFLDVIIDAEDKVLEGIREDGTKVIGGDLNVEGSAKILGEMEVAGVAYKVVKNSEYLAVWVDAEDKVIFGLKADGKTYVGDADFLNDIDDIKAFLQNITDKNIDWDALSSITAVENPEFIEAKTDLEGKLLAGRTPDGAAFENIGFSTPKVSIDGTTIENIEDPEGRIEITTDAEEMIISYRDSDGVKHEVVGIESGSVSTNSLNLSAAGMTAFQQALKDSGFNPGGSGDWSDYISNDGDNPLHLPMPRCAMLNIITDYDLTTLSKVSRPEGFPGVNCELPTQVEFWDMQGNYFKKWTLMSAQGNSSMFYNKKNLAFDFFDSNVEDDAFSVIFGNWVPQDSFHLKAYYTDYFRGSSVVAYHLIDDIELSRNLQTNRAWKKALINGKAGDSTYTDKLGKKINLRIDTGARCMPDGFPVIVYKNGEFYGIYSWQIKKHRDNYHMDKKSPKNIHLDADQIHQDSLFGGTILWNMFEIRNPKNLVYKSASVFDLYSDSATYKLGAIVRDSNNKALYKSKGDSNTGHALNEADWWFKFADACYKYNADFIQAEIAGNADGSTSYPTWASGTAYATDVIVKHAVTIEGKTEEHLFMNTVENNDKEPLITYDSSKDKWYNTDADPDFKNKTKCGWLNVTLTVGVKENIIKLSHRMPEIDAAATPEAKNTLFNKYFDAENLYEYQIEQAIIGDYDGLSGKNWQWTTWDGVKWYVNNYDKDCSFGNNSGGTYICPPFLTYGADFDNGWIAATGPLKYMNDSTLGTDYAQVKKDRYKELRRNGIISTNNIVSKLVDWTNRIGEIHYEMEYDKWNNCICNRGYELNEPWELFETHNYSEYISCPLYSDSDTYEAGDTVRVDVAEGLTYKIPDGYVGTVTGINPLKQLGHRDSIYRFENWVSQRISLFDAYCNYTDTDN